MNKWLRWIVCFDVLRAFSMFASAAFFFYFGAKVFPEIQMQTVQENISDTPTAAIVGAFGGGLAVAVVASLLVVFACAGFVLGIIAAALQFKNTHMLKMQTAVKCKKRFIAFMILGAFIECIVSVFFLSVVCPFPLTYVPVILSSSFNLLFLISAVTLKTVIYIKQIKNPEV